MDAIKNKSEFEFYLIEFFISSDKMHYFGINIGKVNEIIKIPKIVKIPDAHRTVLGTIQFRGNIITIIHLPFYLGYKNDKSYDDKKNKIIITNINNRLNGFLVDDITRIYKVNWTDLEDYSSVPDLKLAESILGIVKIGEHLVQLLDFEKILYEVTPPNINLDEDKKDSYYTERKRKKVYFIEDSTTMRKIITKIIASSGYYVRSFANVQDSLNEIKKFPPDIVVTDLEMPNITGMHLIHLLKENPKFKDIPIIVFSSLGEETNKDKILKAGAKEFINKTEINLLVESIDKYLLGVKI